jgi:uncharacterized membrane protein (GlpM family)
MIMIKGMVTAAASVSYTMGLLLVVTYVFAIILTQLSVGTEMRQDFFTGVALSMYSLIVYGTFLDNLADFCDAISAESTIAFMVVVVFVVLANLTVMNMLIGVLCEVISSVAQEEKESMITEKVYDKFTGLIHEIDRNNDGQVSWNEFERIIGMPSAIAALESVNVDPEGLIDFAQDRFQVDGKPVEITFQEFMAIILDLRGGQQATLKDLMTLQKHVNGRFVTLNAKMEQIEKKLDEMITEAGGA